MQQIASLFDHLVGDGKHCRWNFNAKHLGCGHSNISGAPLITPSPIDTFIPLHLHYVHRGSIGGVATETLRPLTPLSWAVRNVGLVAHLPPPLDLIEISQPKLFLQSRQSNQQYPLGLF
jgi:hypothetical protein